MMMIKKKMFECLSKHSIILKFNGSKLESCGIPKVHTNALETITILNILEMISLEKCMTVHENFH